MKYHNYLCNIKNNLNKLKIMGKKYDFVDNFNNGFANVKLNGKYGIIDITGKEVIEIKYDWVDYFNNGFACVELNDKYGIIDITGKEVVECKYKTLSGAEKALNKYLSKQK